MKSAPLSSLKKPTCFV